MDIQSLAQIAEAVSEQDEPALIYRTSLHGGKDEPVGYMGDPNPVRALELWAEWTGISDYSVDQDELRVILCPAHSVTRFYVYA